MTAAQKVPVHLRDVRSECGQQFLTDLRRVVAPPGPSFIDDLDDALCLIGKESDLRTRSPLQKSDYIELQGGPASGKTQLLYFIAATTILPPKIVLQLHRLGEPSESQTHSIDLQVGGRGKAVYVIDFDGRWDTVALAEVLTKQLDRRIDGELYGEMRQQGWGRPDRQQLEKLAAEALERLHVCRPTSLQGAMASLMSLPAYMADSIPDQEIMFLMLDGLSSFYWQIMAEQKRRSGSQAPFTRSFARILETITFLRHKFGFCVVTTNWSFLQAHQSTSGAEENIRHKYHHQGNENLSATNHLPPPYPGAVPRKKGKAVFSSDFPLLSSFTHQISFSRAPIAPFPGPSTLEALLKDSKRNEQIRSAGPQCTVSPFDDLSQSLKFSFPWPSS